MTRKIKEDVFTILERNRRDKPRLIKNMLLKYSKEMYSKMKVNPIVSKNDPLLIEDAVFEGINKAVDAVPIGTEEINGGTIHQYCFYCCKNLERSNRDEINIKKDKSELKNRDATYVIDMLITSKINNKCKLTILAKGLFNMRHKEIARCIVYENFESAKSNYHQCKNKLKKERES